MKPLFLSLALSFGADAASTHIGLASGRAQEMVLPTQNPWAADAIIAGEAVVTMWALDRLHKTHPKAALILGWGIVGFRAGVAAHNMSVVR